MLSNLSEINWLAVAAATAVFAVLGGVYFTAIVAKPYAVALGNENRELPKPGPLFIIGPLIASLSVVIASALLLRELDINSFRQSSVFGLVVGVGFLVAQTLTIAINPNFPRPLRYTLINAPYFVTSAVAASVILTQWQ